MPLTTSAMALFLRLLPSQYHFVFLPILSHILFTLSLVLFGVSTLIFLLRIAWFRTIALDDLSAPAEMAALALEDNDIHATASFGFVFLPTWPAAWLGIVGFTILDAAVPESPAVKDKSFVVFGYVGWWIGAGWTMATVGCVMAWLLSGPRAGRRTPAGRFVRPVSLVVATGSVGMVAWIGALLSDRVGGTGGNIVSTDKIGPVVVFSFCTVGTSLLMAAAVFAVLLHELVLVGHAFFFVSHEINSLGLQDVPDFVPGPPVYDISQTPVVIVPALSLDFNPQYTKVLSIRTCP